MITRRLLCAVLLSSVVLLGGCTSFPEYIRNGFKVGPNYRKPGAPVSAEWIDANLPEIQTDAPPLDHWWTVFNDPYLNELIEVAYRQNLDVRTAGMRILEARAQRNIAAGELLPQLQEAFGGYDRINLSSTKANLPPPGFFDPHIDNWSTGFNLSWELDFWGRFRRALEAEDAKFDASIENYDDVLVLLFAEVATSYVQIRSLQERLVLINQNIDEQRKLAKMAKDRGQIDQPRNLGQAQLNSNLYDTEAFVYLLKTALRQANNDLCILLGIPPRDLIAERLGTGKTPVAPKTAVVGIPAELLRRRPDVRRAERLVAAQSARIGLSTSDLYPRLRLIGSIGYEAENLADLYSSTSIAGQIGPSFKWAILNYGRILNNIRVQDARFQQEVMNYQSTVLRAGREVENSLVAFVNFQVRAKKLFDSATEAKLNLEGVYKRYEVEQKLDPNMAFVVSRFLTDQQQKEVEARANIASSLIRAYAALGGGWQVRLQDGACAPFTEVLPPPMPVEGAPQGAPELIPPPMPAPMPAPMQARPIFSSPYTAVNYAPPSGTANSIQPATGETGQ